MYSVDNKDIEVSIVKEEKDGKIIVVDNMEHMLKSAPKKSEIKISASLEDYLEKIYLLSLERKEVRVTDIAEKLNLSKPSVNRAVNSLAAEGLINHAHYGSVELTDKGKTLSKQINKKNKTIKQFLIECLDVDEATAEQEAYDMKHYISKGTCNKLKNFIKR